MNTKFLVSARVFPAQHKRICKSSISVLTYTFQQNRRPIFFLHSGNKHLSLSFKIKSGSYESVGDAKVSDALNDLPPLPELQFDGDEETDELDNWNLLKILHSEMPDQEVNEIVWRCLGYQQTEAGSEGGEESSKWVPVSCFPKWQEKYPTPPDVIGVTRIYLKETDGPVMKANQALVRSIPQDCKQNLKAVMLPYGFKGWKMDDLTPNKTRRAQVVNWLLYYRDHLRGKTMEQLVQEREERRAKNQINVREKPME
mmetsp:Transcript_2501/g.3459  ORF Transcript_2501/g.3459 Transcript_2501/m.3459 type:complete len:256 (+) Transcript_2501:28-795(+)